MEVLKRLLSGISTARSSARAATGQLGGSGRKIIRFCGGTSSAIGILYGVREENVAFWSSLGTFAATACRCQKYMARI